jgi:hypothetical protein
MSVSLLAVYEGENGYRHHSLQSLFTDPVSAAEVSVDMVEKSIMHDRKVRIWNRELDGLFLGIRLERRRKIPEDL